MFISVYMYMQENANPNPFLTVKNSFDWMEQSRNETEKRPWQCFETIPT